MLATLSDGLLDGLKSVDHETEPHVERKNIQSIFAAIGVDIVFEGQLPNNVKQASLFVTIVREGSTNAVRHGLATRINIKSEVRENYYSLTIKNNGYTSSVPISPGSGLSLMKKKVLEHGGVLDILQHPLFTLFVILPGGELNA